LTDTTHFTAAILTVSDGVSRGIRQDHSGDAVAGLLSAHGFEVVARAVVPDELDRIADALVELAERARLVVSTGGTGLGPRDVTPEATRRVLDRETPGLVGLMLTEGLRSTPLAALSRAAAGSRGSSLIVNLPGSPKGSTESLTALLGVLAHALTILGGDTEHR
jgi:molybdenum cofactor synthesis domain-containing protein